MCLISPKSSSNRKVCPLGCRAGQEYANIYNHMKKVHGVKLSSIKSESSKSKSPQPSSLLEDNNGISSTSEDANDASEEIPPKPTTDVPLFTDTISPAKCHSFTTLARSEAEVSGLNSCYPNNLFQELEGYIRQTGRSLPRSNHPREVVQVVSKYLFFANSGKKVESEGDIPWQLLTAQDKIHTWLSKYQNIGTTWVSLYNKLDYIHRATKFCCTTKSIKLSNEFLAFVTTRLAEFSRKKKSTMKVRKIEERERPVLNLQKVYWQIMVGDAMVMVFNDVVRDAETTEQPLQSARFLVGMRIAMVHAFIGIVSRPSGIINLKMADALKPYHGNWDGDGVVILCSCEDFLIQFSLELHAHSFYLCDHHAHASLHVHVCSSLPVYTSL